MTSNRRVFLKQLGFGATGLGLFTLLPACRTVPGLALSSTLPRSAPETQGVSSAAIQGFIEAIAQSKHEFHSFMLVRHGQVIAKHGGLPIRRS